jgi:hypothetical protein
LTPANPVTISYVAEPPCGLRSNLPIVVSTQGNECGVLTRIGTNPQVSVTAGEVSTVEFNAYNLLVALGQSASFRVTGRNSCGLAAAFSGNTSVDLMADTDGLLSASNDFTGASRTLNLAFVNGQTEKAVYYKLTANTLSYHNVRAQFLDPNLNYVTDRYLSVTPTASGVSQLLSNVSVDKGVLSDPSSLTKTVTISAGEMAYINGEPRAANVIAEGPSELIEIPFERLDHVLFQKPMWSKALMRTLSKRLKNANNYRAS